MDQYDGISYAQILKKGTRFIFHTVNGSGQQFQLYAEPLLNAWKNKDSYTRIKRKDNDPERSTGYYPGEVYGVIELSACKNYYFLALYIGAAYQTLKFNDEVENCIASHEYCFPCKKFENYMAVLTDIVKEQNIFSQLLAGSDVYIDVDTESLYMTEIKTE